MREPVWTHCGICDQLVVSADAARCVYCDDVPLCAWHADQHAAVWPDHRMVYPMRLPLE